MRIELIAIGLLALLSLSCSEKQSSIVEVTTFRLKTTANATKFQELDAQVESKFTSNQAGFIRRQSGVNEKQEFVVIVNWNTAEEADASMQKFMSDPSVQEYAAMIEGSSMQMARYKSEDTYAASGSNFIEVMSFKTKDKVEQGQLSKINNKVEKEVTAPKTGFKERITGTSDDNTQMVLVYWDNKENSDAALQPFMNHKLSKKFMGLMDQSSVELGRYETLSNISTKVSEKDKVVALLNSFNTGDQGPISYINPEKYIQHNLAVGDGLAGFGEVIKNAPPQGFKANVIRAFQDGDFVFTHTEYEFFGPKAAFDIFRFEDGQIVEHWDNLIPVQAPNPNGRTQFDGSTALTDLDQTEPNKQLIKGFIENVLLEGQMDMVTNYINAEKYMQHNPAVADGLEGFGAAMKYFAENGLVMKYEQLHMVLGQGNFVLTVSEGKFGKNEPTSFYDLFRVENGKIVEHWDVIETIPPTSEWKNQNGKF